MDQRVFGPYYSTPPENRRPTPLIVPTGYTPPRPKTRTAKRRLLIAVRRITKNQPTENP